jgi:hypothetical protein
MLKGAIEDVGEDASGEEGCSGCGAANYLGPTTTLSFSPPSIETPQ